MKKLSPEKLTVTLLQGITETKPKVPRNYTLAHSDLTAELFLSIGMYYDYEKIGLQRDEVLGKWIFVKGKYQLNLYCYVNGRGCPVFTATRFRIFRKELPLAIEAIIHGDKEFFQAHPKLDSSNIIVFFNSVIPFFNRSENWGLVEDYK